VAKLHAALEEKGFYCGEEDTEDWIFGAGTEEAIVYFQNSASLPETGIADSKTWQALLGSDSSTAADGDVSEQQSSSRSTGVLNAREAEATAMKMKTLHLDDGGKEVLLLQRLLERKGFDCDEEDIEWWQFGPSTEQALLVFQACHGLPETGRCTAGDWVKLLTGCEAKLLDDISNEQDLRAEKGVYLLGEQRFERRNK